MHLRTFEIKTEYCSIKDAERIVFMVLVTVKKMRFSVEKIISLSGISDIKNGQKSGNDDSNIASIGGKSHTDFCQKNGIGFF